MNPKFLRKELYEEDHIFNEQEFKGKQFSIILQSLTSHKWINTGKSEEPVILFR